MSAFRFLILLSVLAIVLLLALRLDTTTLIAALSKVSTLHIAGILCLVQAQIVLSALRWRFTADRLGQTIASGEAIREYYVATLLNQSLPGGVAGDALRAYRMRAEGPGGWKQPAKAVVFERLSGQIVFFAFAALGLFAWPNIVGVDASDHMAIVGFAVVVGLGALMLLGWKIAKSKGVIGQPGMLADIRKAFLDRGAWAIQIALSLTVVLAYVAAFFIASHAVGARLPLIATVTIVPLTLLAMLIPSGLGGWGSREAAAMALWPLIGATTSEGLAASLVYGGLSLAGALPGLAFLVWSGAPKTPQA
ncbi:lysylphosphatidylglycerol synthase transmembrane domain-containing protein [Rhizobium sp. AAP43]|uniref:lysylphosphatidylglycerol synthase transmembrane domain-containing protein n=1 Tax=Rhizobium sp. AAP43 TaxID=1523420 RepID=UPI0006CC9287|nr:lysylphosphatidylglycerol synthase transmembrane domain-containing protein [Rhizobium sp. AAP43]KPF44601.1 hypothetical protein IP76_10380 [Rhizobium sp. AAP43]